MTIITKLQLQQRSRISWAIRDTMVMFKRSMLHIREDMEQLVGLTIQPVMFVVLFRYVFGGAIDTGTSYINFLMAGIFVQTAAFGSTVTGVSIASDLSKGIVDRFRSLPMTKSAVLMGHVLADLARNAFATVVMVVAGLAVGFRPEASPLEWVYVFGLLMLFTFSLSWVMAIIGLVSKSVEFVQQMGFVLIFPITFISSAFVPSDTLPKVLRIFAENQPLTQVIEAVRALLLNQPVGDYAWKSVIWSVGMILIAFPIASALFRKQSK
jgi:ABC-2 type transport system permease protein